MEARKMFEELNLEQIRNDDNYIEYVRNGLGGYISILFSLRWKSIKSTYGYQARGTNCHEIPLDELKAIIQQCIELGWLEEETCTNKLEYDSRDVFKCSNCGFISVHQTGVKSDEDNRVEFFYSYKPKYCPNCGRKIVD